MNLIGAKGERDDVNALKFFQPSQEVTGGHNDQRSNDLRKSPRAKMR